MGKGIRGVSQEGSSLIIRVIKGKSIIPLDTHTAPKGLFDPPRRGRSGSLTMCPALCEAEDGSKPSFITAGARRGGISKYHPRKISPQKPSTRICLITERLMSEYLNKTKGTASQPKRCSIKDVIMGEDLSREQRELVRTMCEKYQDVFASSTNKGSVPTLTQSVKLFHTICQFEFEDSTQRE